MAMSSQALNIEQAIQIAIKRRVEEVAAQEIKLAEERIKSRITDIIAATTLEVSNRLSFIDNGHEIRISCEIKK